MSLNLGEQVLRRLLPEVVDLAKQTGKRILEAESEAVLVQHKSDMTPVTNADLAANQLIVKTLSGMAGNFPVLSEESTIIPFKVRQQWPCYWLVDPLDGTREFINQNGEYSINIALIDNHQAVLGVIYAPVQGQIYFATRGEGAYKIDALSEKQQITVCSKRRLPLIVACGNNAPGSAFETSIRLLGKVQFVPMGSSLKSCLVADGQADLYARLGPTSEWDTAAAQCIVEEAGGKLTDLNLDPLRYNTKDSLLNPHFLVFGDQQEDWKKYFVQQTP